MSLTPLFHNASKGTPHVLLQLSVRSFNRYKSNSIELKNITLINGQIMYTDVIFGANVKANRGKRLRRRINMNEIKKITSWLSAT